MKQPFLLRISTLAIAVLCFIAGCVSRDEPRPAACENTDLAITVTSQINPNGCTTNDGSITVNATGGEAPYAFALDNNASVSTSEFTGLGAGVFTLKVIDAKGCEKDTQVTLAIPGASLAASVAVSADNQCLTDNGALSVTASGGFPPYEYKLDAAAFGSVSTFSNLKNGNYVITVKDNTGCSLTLSTAVTRGSTGISYNNEVKSIITAKCATSSCHNGNQNPNLASLSNVQSNKAQMKSRIEGGSMPPFGSTALTTEEKAKIICWIDDGANNN